MTQRRSFSTDLAEVGAARRFVAGVLAARGVDPFPVDVVVSELATNAAVHAGTPYTVGVEVRGDEVRIEVVDGSGVAPLIRGRSSRRQRGRGLLLVDRLASSWGSAPTRGGKTVWCVVPVEVGAEAEARSDLESAQV